MLWTYEAGDAIESSAAIVDGVVYVGSQTGELHAVNLADGKLKWKYKASADGIGESSPTVAGGLVYIGDLSGVLHAVQTRDRAGGVDVQDEHRDQVVAGRRGRQGASIGSYDSNLYALGAKDGKLAWKVQTEGYVHATPAVVDGVAYIAGCDEILRGIRISDGVEVLKMPFGAYTGASPAVVDGRAYYGTYENDVLAVDLKAKKIVWSYKHPERSFPFYSSPAVLGDRVIVGGRDKMVHALDKKTGKALWTFATGARVDSSPVVAGGLRLHRLERREALRPRRRDGQERVPVRGRRPAVGIPRAGVRPSRHRLAGRQAVLSWDRSGIGIGIETFDTHRV